jgi:hypothetical protein
MLGKAAEPHPCLSGRGHGRPKWGFGTATAERICADARQLKFTALEPTLTGFASSFSNSTVPVCQAFVVPKLNCSLHLSSLDQAAKGTRGE